MKSRKPAAKKPAAKKKPQSFILYSALTKLTLYHTLIYSVVDDRHRIYVRAELVNCHYNEAMDRVKPLPGETFLNTVPA